MQSNSIIKNIKGRQVYDSRGHPTVQCQVTTDLGKFRAIVPSGASTGKYEACQLRDNDPSINLGKSVYRAVENINTILREALIGKDCRNQKQIDKLMSEQLDGQKNEYGYNKSKLGANAILSVSMAICRAAAQCENIPLYEYINKLVSAKYERKLILPCPAFNVINGGKHAGNQLPYQQFMILPTGAETFSQAMKMGTQIYHILKNIIQKKHGISSINVGDEGGFAPPIIGHLQALELITEAIKKSGYQGKIEIAMDCAASQFYDQKQSKYNLNFKTNKPNLIKGSELESIYKEIAQKYPVISIEDPFDQDDWQAWQSLTSSLPNTQIVGDDLLVTNISRISQAIQKKSCTALLLKINQIGTISEAISAAELAYQNNWGVMVSHRSGQTEDSFIAHLVVGLGTGQIKSGAPCRSERLAKYNELLRIEEELNKQEIKGQRNGMYAGRKFISEK